MNNPEAFNRQKNIGEQVDDVLYAQYRQAGQTLFQSEMNLGPRTLQEELQLQEARQTLAFLLPQRAPTRQEELYLPLLLSAEQTGDLTKRFQKIETFAVGVVDALKQGQLLQATHQNPYPERQLERTIRNALFSDGEVARQNAEQSEYDQKIIELMRFYANQQIPIPRPEDIILINSFTQTYQEPNAWQKFGRDLLMRPYIPFIYIYSHDGNLPAKRDFFPAHVFIDANIAELPNRSLIKSDTVILGSKVSGKDKQGNKNLGISARNFATTAHAAASGIHVCATNLYLDGGIIDDAKFSAEQTTILQPTQAINTRIFTMEVQNPANSTPDNTIIQINSLQEMRQRVDFETKFGT